MQSETTDDSLNVYLMVIGDIHSTVGLAERAVGLTSFVLTVRELRTHLVVLLEHLE